MDQITALDPQGGEAGRNWPLTSLNWALISRNWALVAGVAFFLADTFLMADGFARPVAMSSRVLVILIWLISLIAVAVLWLRGSSKFNIQNPFVRAEPGAHRRLLSSNTARIAAFTRLCGPVPCLDLTFGMLGASS